VSIDRTGCRGEPPLDGRVEPWQEALAGDQDRLSELIATHGSPLNLLSPAPMRRNARELMAQAAERSVDMRLYFARKANKALCFVDQAQELGMGIDVASLRELEQTVGHGATGDDLMVTAAIKPRELLERCYAAGATVAVDNEDELDLLRRVRDGAPAGPTAMRLAPRGSATRFGMESARILQLAQEGGLRGLDVRGVHFHVDGYRVEDRVTALSEAIWLADRLVELGLEIEFVDIGGGVPISYLEEPEQWTTFWSEHGRGLRGERRPLTFDAHPLESVYPFHQSPTRGEWLARILDAPVAGAHSVAAALRQRRLQLRLEPGRSLLDGCGLTAARVEFRKRVAGDLLVGLAMNRTQCRSTSDDFLVDPILVRPGDAGPPGAAAAGFLVGAYCIERELLSLRRLRFARGVAVGDIVLFVNTAGYLMHILESASHQIPLAQNLVAGNDGCFILDRIDASTVAEPVG
jgi:diaminopimelate decarboxylase